MTHIFFHPVAFSFFSRLNKLQKLTNYAAESATEQQRYLDEARACKHSGADKHTTRPAGVGNMIGLDSKCQPIGQISCVMMRNRSAVWGRCACVCVCV